MKAKTALIQSLMLAVVRFGTGNVIIASTFITLRPLGYLQCASRCLEYSDCEEIFYSKTKLECRLNYLDNDFVNFFPTYFETFMRVSRSIIRQLKDSFNNNSTAANDCAERKRRIMLKSGALVCVGFLPAWLCVRSTAKVIHGREKPRKKEKPDAALSNVALNKPTKQSTTYPSAARSRNAVDGKWDMTMYRCTGTLYQHVDLWWTVDLVQLYYIYEIHIQNRGDCCDAALSNVALNKPTKQSTTYPSAARSRNAVDGKWDMTMYRCTGTLYQHVDLWWTVDLVQLYYIYEIHIQNRGDCCDAALSNVALNKPTKQSTTYPSAARSRNAVDGKWDMTMYRCTGTLYQHVDLWWTVDLVQLYYIYEIHIQNRGDCCDAALSNVALNKPTKQSTTYPSAARSRNAVDGKWDMTMYRCTGTLYQHVDLWWTVDLVQLYYIYEIHIQNRGDCCDAALSNVALNKPTKQSTTYPSAARSRNAVDGKWDMTMYRCTGTLYQHVDLWWTVDLVQLYYIYEIHIQNRGDCCDAALSNVALNKPTKQSTTYPSAARSRNAVDGKWDMTMYRCTGTLYQHVDLWWTVDLVQLYYIYEIHIQNRGDCCGKRLKDFSVQVDVKAGDMSVVAYFDGFALLEQLIKFPFKYPVVGRNIRIQRHNRGYLALCEVAVYAHMA